MLLKNLYLNFLVWRLRINLAPCQHLERKVIVVPTEILGLAIYLQEKQIVIRKRNNFYALKT